MHLQNLFELAQDEQQFQYDVIPYLRMIALRYFKLNNRVDYSREDTSEALKSTIGRILDLSLQTNDFLIQKTAIKLCIKYQYQLEWRKLAEASASLDFNEYCQLIELLVQQPKSFKIIEFRENCEKFIGYANFIKLIQPLVAIFEIKDSIELILYFIKKIDMEKAFIGAFNASNTLNSLFGLLMQLLDTKSLKDDFMINLFISLFHFSHSFNSSQLVSCIVFLSKSVLFTILKRSANLTLIWSSISRNFTSNPNSKVFLGLLERVLIAESNPKVSIQIIADVLVQTDKKTTNEIDPLISNFFNRISRLHNFNDIYRQLVQIYPNQPCLLLESAGNRLETPVLKRPFTTGSKQSLPLPLKIPQHRFLSHEKQKPNRLPPMSN